MRKYNSALEFHGHMECPVHRNGHPTHSTHNGAHVLQLWSLGRIKQPCGCSPVCNKTLYETGRFLQNFLRFSPTSGVLIWKWTPQQVSYTSFPHFAPLLTQRSKTNSLVCFYLLSKIPGLVQLWLKGAAIPVDEMIITQLLNLVSQTACSHLHPQHQCLNCCIISFCITESITHFTFIAPLFSLVIYLIASLWLFISSFPLLTVPKTAPSNLDMLHPG